MSGFYPSFQIFIKPAGPACNLGCSYCYYLDAGHLYGNRNHYSMPFELLEVYIRQHMEASKDPVIAFSWHGGEPMLAGIEFYRKVVEMQDKFCPPGKSFINGIQTNGTLADEEWCRFLAEEHFVVGISMDGPEKLHDVFRTKKNGQGTFRNVLHGYDLLLLHGVDPEILCVVNAVNVKYPSLIYRFFKSLGAKFISFLPLVERRPYKNARVSSRTVPAEEFGNFLCAVFDEWIDQDIGKVKIQIFEEALRTSFDQEHTLCIFKPVCGGVPVVEHTGDFYSCDHYADRQHLLGNIKINKLSELLDSPAQQSFGQAKQLTLPDKCIRCRVRSMCNGECPRNRFIRADNGESGLNYLCPAYEMFFNHCMPFMEAVAFAHRNR